MNSGVSSVARLSLTVTLASNRKARVLTGCWLTTDGTPVTFFVKGSLWKEMKYLHARLGQSPYVCLACHLLSPSTWFKGLLHACCCLGPLTGRQDIDTSAERVSQLVWSGSTRGAFFKSWKYKLKAYVLSKHDMPGSRENRVNLPLCPASSASLPSCIAYWLSILSSGEIMHGSFLSVVCIIWPDMNSFYPSS